MSLPNYLARIKSSGIYRYVFDKSLVPPQNAETLRMVVGYSEKGPFNTPIYIDNKSDFILLFGNINKRLERKGVFFHRLALQALSAGPILALNIKPFTSSEKSNETAEQVQYLSFNPNCKNDWAGDYIKKLDVINVYDTNRFWKLESDNIPNKIGSTSKYINIITTDAKEQSCTIFYRPIIPSSYDVTVNDWYAAMTDIEIPTYLENYKDIKLNKFFGEIYVFKGKFTSELVLNNNNDQGPLYNYFDIDKETKEITLKADYKDSFGKDGDALQALSNDSNSNFIAKYEGCILPYFKDGNGKYISLDILFNDGNGYHKMLMKLNDTLLDEDFINTLLSDTDEIFNQNEISIDYVPAYKPIYVEGYTYKTIDNKKTTGPEIQKLVFDMLNSKGIFEALTNRVDCEYHYIIDTFDSYVEPGCKKTLSNIAKTKDNALAILNFPAMSKFMENNVFYDTNFTPHRFDISKLNNKLYFSLPSEIDGASWCAFYNPIVLSDGSLKTTVPSAALVSNLYMEKWESRQPYYIVAGPNYGKIQEDGLIGPDYNYSRADLDVLEPMGTNVIIYVPKKGTYINSNQTAKQVPVTALSKAHVRELVIYLQNEIENMLQSYQWELNTSTLRDTIKNKADTILEIIQANGGVYEFKNQCDENNNTPDVIDNEMIILDTSIEPARGSGKMIQRLTIHKTGGISSTTN